MIVLYGLMACDTCRKALKSLRATAPDVQFVDVRAEGVSVELLARFYDAFGPALVNSRSTTWRGLSDVERQSPALELLAQHPTLMKRPVIDNNGTLTLGWGNDVQVLF